MHGTHVDAGELVKLLEDMVRINSVNPSLVAGAPGEAEIAEYVAERMGSLGLEARVFEVEPGRANAVGVLKGSGGGKTLLLNGHLDTVGIDYMTIDPLDPVLKDGKVYGRGTFDMKGGLAASLAAVKAIVDSGLQLKGNIIVAGVCDEEYASIGTERLMEDTRADAAIIGEPTWLHVQVAHKGFAWIDVETRGVAAHGSAWQHGVDAIAKMGSVLTGIEGLQERLFETEHPLMGPPSIHASIIAGGRELSTYPDHCKLQVERRMIPGEDGGKVDNEMKGLLESIAAEDTKFQASHRITFLRGPMEVSPSEEICQILHKATAEVTGTEPEFIGGSGWMDTEIIYGKGIPAVAFGPKGDGAHAAVEYVDIESVVQAAKVQELVIRRFCEVEG
jgi:acetylornithine deacetylase